MSPQPPCGSGSSVGTATELRAGRSGDRIPVGERFSAPVQTGPGAHPASCTMGTGSFRGVKSGRGVTLTPHPVPVPWSLKSRAIPLFPHGPYGLYRASVPVQGCTLFLPEHQWTRPSTPLSRLHVHTQALGRTPLDERPALCRDLYLTTHITHRRETSMPPVGFEPATPAS
jgi:hypothetical protein